MAHVKLHPPEPKSGGIDVWYEIYLNRQEVDTLDSQGARESIVAVCVSADPIIGAFLAAYILEHVNKIKERAGRDGSKISTTIRNGVERREFDVWPLPE